jgi:hypothetical protein
VKTENESLSFLKLLVLKRNFVICALAGAQRSNVIECKANRCSLTLSTDLYVHPVGLGVLVDIMRSLPSQMSLRPKKNGGLVVVGSELVPALVLLVRTERALESIAFQRGRRRHYVARPVAAARTDGKNKLSPVQLAANLIRCCQIDDQSEHVQQHPFLAHRANRSLRASSLPLTPLLLH